MANELRSVVGHGRTGGITDEFDVNWQEPRDNEEISVVFFVVCLSICDSSIKLSKCLRNGSVLVVSSIS